MSTELMENSKNEGNQSNPFCGGIFGFSSNFPAFKGRILVAKPPKRLFAIILTNSRIEIMIVVLTRHHLEIREY